MVERDPLDTAALRRLAWTLGHAGRLEESEASFPLAAAVESVRVRGARSAGDDPALHGSVFPEALAEVEKELEETGGYAACNRLPGTGP